MLEYARLYSDENGESHFEDVQVHLALIEYAPPAPPLSLSAFAPARQFGFMQAPAGWSSDWHPTSVRTMFFVLSGEWEVTASDGETRTFTAGSILLAKDTDGRGHTSRVIGELDSVAAMLELSE